MRWCADLLNAAGLTTGKGKPYTATNMASIRRVYKIPGPRTVAVGDGEVSVKQAAIELGIPADAVYNWLRLGQDPARRDRPRLTDGASDAGPDRHRHRRDEEGGGE